MANSDKNLVITPNISSSTGEPTIAFSGSDASVGPQSLQARIYPTANGTLAFEGSAGQLFSITNSLTGTIFSVNDVSGLPSIEVLDTGSIRLARYSGNVLIGNIVDDGVNKLQFAGNTAFGNFSANNITFSGSILGSGAGLSSLNATSITTGTIANARTTGSSANGANSLVLRDANGDFSARAITATTFIGPLVGDGISLTNLNASNVTSGTLSNARTTADSANGASTIVARDAGGSFSANTITASLFSGSGASLTNLNGTNIATGTVANARTTAASANGASTIVARDANGDFTSRVVTATLAGNILAASPIVTTTDGNFAVRQNVSSWLSTSHPIIQWQWNAPYEDNLALSSGGNTITTNQTSLVVSEAAGIVFGRSNTTPTTNTVLSTEWGRANSSGIFLSVGAFTGSGSGLSSLNATNLSSGTVPGARGVTAGSGSASFVAYNGTTATTGQFDGGTTAPSGTTRLNYGGNFYAANVNIIGTADTSTAASHYVVETGSDGFIRPKTLANAQAEIVTAATVNAIAQIAGSATQSVVRYSGTTAVAGQFDGGTTTPSGTTRLNYGGVLYATGFSGNAALMDVMNSANVNTYNYPQINPSLSLDFVNSGVLDPRITFTRTSEATFFDSNGILRVAANNVSRIDYDPVTLSRQGLLIEEARTNLVLQSEDLATTWTIGPGVTVSTNATTAPSGTTTADKIQEDASTGSHLVSQNITFTAASYTASVFVKKAERDWIRVLFFDGTNTFSGFFNLTAGTVGTLTGTGTTATITAVGNGWYRCTITATTAAGSGSFAPRIALADGNSSYTGVTGNGLFLWGAQLEAGAFPTSYIPTTTNQRTREADMASVNTLSPWYNQSEMTFYAEYAPIYTASATVPSNTPHVLQVYNTAVPTNNYAIRGVEPSLSQIFVARNPTIGSQFPAVALGSYGQAGVVRKLGYAINSSDLQPAVNGALGTMLSNNVAALMATHDKMDIGSGTGGAPPYQLNGWLRRITYYPRRLSNAELQAITA